MQPYPVVPCRGPVVPRDPHEPHRVASPLELFFDLIFVVAIASAGAQCHHALIEGHYNTLLGYVMAFGAIWWAWLNYTWYSSAYDCEHRGCATTWGLTLAYDRPCGCLRVDVSALGGGVHQAAGRVGSDLIGA